MKFLDTISHLGETLNSAYKNNNYNSESFPDLAANSLNEWNESYAGRWAAQRIFDEVIQQIDELPDLVRPENLFGDSRFTLFKGLSFAVEINVWKNNITAVHEHSFLGAFTILSGSAVQSTYSFKPSKLYSHQLHKGKLTSTGIEILNVGQVRKIKMNDEFIHNLVHLKNPTLTLIIRTYGNEPQINCQRNFYGGYASEGFYQSPFYTNAINIIRATHHVKNPSYHMASIEKLISAANLVDSFNIFHNLSYTTLTLIDTNEFNEEKTDFHQNALSYTRRMEQFLQYRGQQQEDDVRFIMALLYCTPNMELYTWLYNQHYQLNLDQQEIVKTTIRKVNQAFSLFGEAQEHAIVECIPLLADNNTSDELKPLRELIEQSIIRLFIV